MNGAIHRFIVGDVIPALKTLPDESVQVTYSPVRKQVMKGFEFTRSWVEAAPERVAWFNKRPAEELYDVVNDPFELHNLAGDPAHAGTLAELRTQLEAWMKAQGDEGNATTGKMKAWQSQQRKEGRDHLRTADQPLETQKAKHD
jgi:arylsulfatase A-like enzyme